MIHYRLSLDNFSFPSLSVLTPRSHLLGSQHSTLPLSLSFHSPLPPFQLCCQLLSHSTGKEQALILHTAPKLCLLDLTALELLELPFERDRNDSRQTGGHRQTDRNGKCIVVRTQNPRSTTAMLETKHFVFTQPLLCVCVWVCA